MQSTSTRILVVAHRSVATPALLEELRWRSAEEPCELVLLIPGAGVAAATAEWTLRRALRLFERATGAPVEGLLYREHDEVQAIESALRDGHFDEVMISTLPAQVSQWLREDIPARVGALGVTVTVVTPDGVAPCEPQLSWSERATAPNGRATLGLFAALAVHNAQP
jgi:hypothetical protein